MQDLQVTNQHQTLSSEQTPAINMYKPNQLSGAARHAVQKKNWQDLRVYIMELYKINPKDPETIFLSGVYSKNTGNLQGAISDFRNTLQLDPRRYDAAIELANLLPQFGLNSEAISLINNYKSNLTNSPLYLDMAGTIYSNLGLHQKASGLFEKADRLQPNTETIEANLASCYTYTGDIDKAYKTYTKLLDRFPFHQRYHYKISLLRKSRESTHIDAMKNCLTKKISPDSKNIFTFYALGKELEDLQKWDESFHYYNLAGNTATSVSNYSISKDIELIDSVIETCSPQWLKSENIINKRKKPTKTHKNQYL